MALFQKIAFDELIQMQFNGCPKLELLEKH